MTEYITDTYDFIVKIVLHGNLKIRNVLIPETFEPGKSFNIEYDVVNIGGSDVCYGRIMEDQNEIYGSRWQGQIDINGTKHIVTTIPARSTDLRAKIVVGYVPSAT